MEDKFKILIEFIRKNNNDKIFQLLSQEKDPEKLIEYEPDEQCPHPLYIASKQGNTEIVNLLLQNKGDPYVRHEKKGLAPIHIAVVKNFLNVVKILVEFDHDLVDLETDTSGNDPLSTPLHFAVELEDPNVEILSYLINSGANINQYDIRKRTPLWRATHRGHLYNIQRLLSAGADVNLADEHGITPLGLAASLGHKSACELLLENKANPNISDHMGDTPLHLATQIQIQRSIFNYNLEMSQNHIQTFTTLLLQGDADPGVCNKDGDTPLDVIDIPLANLFDHIIKHKIDMRVSGKISFNSILDKSEQQLNSEYGISPDDTKLFSNSIKSYHEYKKSKKQSTGPCTLINTKLTPYKRKFKHLYDSGIAVQSTNQENDNPTVTQCPVTGSVGPVTGITNFKCPVTGSVGPVNGITNSKCPVIGSVGPVNGITNSKCPVIGSVGSVTGNTNSKCPVMSKNSGETKSKEGVCPITGQRGILPEGHAKLMENDTPKLPSKCPFSPDYQPGDGESGCAQQ